MNGIGSIQNCLGNRKEMPKEIAEPSFLFPCEVIPYLRATGAQDISDLPRSDVYARIIGNLLIAHPIQQAKTEHKPVALTHWDGIDCLTQIIGMDVFQVGHLRFLFPFILRTAVRLGFSDVLCVLARTLTDCPIE